MSARQTAEYWLCDECLGIAQARRWGAHGDAIICPVCGHEQREIIGGTYTQMVAKRDEIKRPIRR